MSWIAGPYESVYSQMQTSVGQGSSEEIVMAVMRFKNGAVGMLGDLICPIADTQAGVVGTKGSAMITDTGRKGAVLRVKLDGQDEQNIDVSQPPMEAQGLSSFFNSIKTGAPSPSTIKEARYTLSVALAMQESNRTGKVIKL
jgi:predicted dehydrogenase